MRISRSFSTVKVLVAVKNRRSYALTNPRDFLMDEGARRIGLASRKDG
jgi:hypothetical protein